MKSIIEREATFDNNSDIVSGQSNTEKSSRAFLKDTQWRKICSTVN